MRVDGDGYWMQQMVGGQVGSCVWDMWTDGWMTGHWRDGWLDGEANPEKWLCGSACCSSAWIVVRARLVCG